MKWALPLLLFGSGCNALTGVGKYDMNDCPDGACLDGGTSADGSSASDSATLADAATGSGDGADSAPALTCSGGEAPLTVTVIAPPTAAGEPVVDDVQQRPIAPGTTQSYCASPSGAYRLETKGGTKVNWIGAPCPVDTRCEFTLTAPLGATITAREQ